MTFDFHIKSEDPNIHGYLSLNLSCMTNLRAILCQADLLDDDFERGPWLERESFTGPNADVEFEKVEEDFKTQHGHNGKLPSHKFRTNDHWVVTPEECNNLARLLDYKIRTFMVDVPPQHRDMIKAFISFCQEAAKYDGFVVT